MELIRISESKLKVMLTGEDMRQYELNSVDLDCEDSETRHAFRCILEEAKSQTGFDTHNYRIFIQAYPCRGGGCELYVTKLGERSDNGYNPEEATDGDNPAHGSRDASGNPPDDIGAETERDSDRESTGRPTWVDPDFDKDGGARSRNGTDREKRRGKESGNKNPRDSSGWRMQGVNAGKKDSTAEKQAANVPVSNRAKASDTQIQGQMTKKNTGKALSGFGGNDGCGKDTGTLPPATTVNASRRGRDTRAQYYRFSSLENLLGGCRAMAVRGYARESSVFYNEEKQDWLLLLRETPGHGSLGEFVFLWEFGQASKNAGLESYIQEHCRPLCEGNAVEIFSAL